MTNFQFSSYFMARRKDLKVTQEQVANYVGVSKAAISKWEKGQSYPDITLLPKLATYFNVSIDELLGYEPQMTKEKIAETYTALVKQMNDYKFEQVAENIENLLTEYYSCFPFVLKMAQLYLNYYKEAEQPHEVLDSVFSLCTRVIQMSNNLDLVTEAKFMNALVRVLQNEPQQALELLGEEPKILYGEEQLMATAYVMLGNNEKAQKILQIAHFQNLIMCVTSASESLLIDLRNFDETVRRVTVLVETYNLVMLSVNTVLVFYLRVATGYMMQGRQDEALDIIEKYAKVCCSITFPLALTGDDYFYYLEQWMSEKTNIGTQAPRSSEAIQKDLYTSIATSPVFAPLSGNKKYEAILANLKHQLKLKEE